MGAMVIIGIALVAWGILLVVASRNPKRNMVTRILFVFWTALQFPGLMKDETLVLTDGIGLLLAGLILLSLAVAGFNG